MKCFNLLLLSLSLMLKSIAFGAVVTALPELSKPYGLKLDNGQIFITDGPKMFIYSMKDYRLQTSLGREGEGPGEFKLSPFRNLEFWLLPDKIIINSIGKFSFFTREGKFTKEQIVTSGRDYQPVGDNFVGRGFAREAGMGYTTINLYDSNLKMIKEIYRYLTAIHRDKIVPLNTTWVLDTYDNKVFVAGSPEFEIHVFDQEGNKLRVIKSDHKKIKVTRDFEEEMVKYWKSAGDGGEWYEKNKQRIRFPDYIRAFESFTIADGKIYVRTQRRKDGKSEFVILDINGKLLKTIYLTLEMKDFLDAFPYSIHQEKVYQIVDNQEKEQWELHVNPIQ